MFLSGTVPMTTDGHIPKGKVGADVTTEEAAEHARLVGLKLNGHRRFRDRCRVGLIGGDQTAQVAAHTVWGTIEGGQTRDALCVERGGPTRLPASGDRVPLMSSPSWIWAKRIVNWEHPAFANTNIRAIRT